MIRTQQRRPQPAAVSWLRIRPVGAADTDALRNFLTGLSPRTAYLRFFTGARPVSSAQLGVLTGSRQGVDAIVATASGAIIGHAMAVDTGDSGAPLTADIGVVVADAWQGRGVGSGLMRTLATRANERGVTTLAMDVMSENRRVLTMIADHWPAARYRRDGAYVSVQARLASPAILDQPTLA